VSQIIAVLDSDERYAGNISALLQETMGKGTMVVTFTKPKYLMDYCDSEKLSMLVVTQDSYSKELSELDINTILILVDDLGFVAAGKEDLVAAELIYVDRYQSAEKIRNEILANWNGGTCENNHRRRWKVIGVYTPIHRNLQTNFSLTLGQLLAEKGKALYMNFENYSGFSGWMSQEFGSDVVDLLYFLDCDKDKLAGRIPLAAQSLGKLDILPPASSYFDTYDRSGEKWLELFDAIEAVTEYEYLVLDLSDSMQGLLQVMEYCDRIYTLVRDDALSGAKLAQYEQWMMEHSYAEIMGKTMRFQLPHFEKLPNTPELLTRSELAGYVKAIILEDSLEIKKG